MRTQVYLLPLDGCKAENAIGSLIYKPGTDDIVGFISGAIPDNCVEITLFETHDVPEVPGFMQVAEKIPDSELRVKMISAAEVNAGFADFLRGLLA